MRLRTSVFRSMDGLGPASSTRPARQPHPIGRDPTRVSEERVWSRCVAADQLDELVAVIDAKLGEEAMVTSRGVV